jgi:hypothetical protein
MPDIIRANENLETSMSNGKKMGKHTLSDGELWDAARCIDLGKIKPAYAAFEWQKKRLPEAWNYRAQLEADTQVWLAAGAVPSGRDIAQKIYKWGFGVSNLPPSCDGMWSDAFTSMMNPWHISDEDPSEADSSLADMLKFRALGIAKVSKWICFVDQKRFAIFDSRVSRVLRGVQIEGRRIFPILPSRVPKTGGGVWARGDYLMSGVGSEIRVTLAYRRYLKLISMIQQEIGLPPAKIEMGLFMMGQRFPDQSEIRLPIAREFYQ